MRNTKATVCSASLIPLNWNKPFEGEYAITRSIVGSEWLCKLSKSTSPRHVIGPEVTKCHMPGSETFGLPYEISIT